jgi:hypothetical protein
MRTLNGALRFVQELLPRAIMLNRFSPEKAEDVSFAELLHVPTYGRSSLTTEDLDPTHLGRLNIAILHGRAEFMFIPAGVGRLMNESGYFRWMPQEPTSEEGPLKIWLRTENKSVYWHYHLSCYGWQLEVLNRQMIQIRRLVKSM